MTVGDERFDRAITTFDGENARDPNQEVVGGVARPRELLQAERLSEWVARLTPEASEPLRLAARCQHLRRWEVPRSNYPEGRSGYLQWRTRLGRFHAEESAKILSALGYDVETIAEVGRINAKVGLRSDPDVQAMEDALCLSFLEHELAAFCDKYPDEKVIEILQKSWKKMSERGRSAAIELAPNLGERARNLVDRALSG